MKYKTEYKILEGDAIKLANEMNKAEKEGFIIWGNMTAVLAKADECILYAVLMSKSTPIKTLKDE